MRRLLLLTLCLVACSKGTPDAKPGTTFRVALITPGSVADAAWNAGAYAGLQQLKDSIGATISHVEARTPAEQEEALRSYAKEGYDLVFGHGFEFQQPAERVSKDFPNTIFAITSGERVSGNVFPLVFNIQEATYLLGMVAGGMTKSGKIGFIGGMELPPIKLGYDGWLQGAQATHPGVVSKLTYLNTFDDVAAGKEAALAMIRLGVDQIHHNADQAALGIFAAVKESKGVYVYGANADQSALAPGQVAASAVIDLGRAMMIVGRVVKTKLYKPDVASFGLHSGVIQFVTNPDIQKTWPAGLAKRIQAAGDSIDSGKLVIGGATKK